MKAGTILRQTLNGTAQCVAVLLYDDEPSACPAAVVVRVGRHSGIGCESLSYVTVAEWEVLWEPESAKPVTFHNVIDSPGWIAAHRESFECHPDDSLELG